jgi:hypothetical protein
MFMLHGQAKGTLLSPRLLIAEFFIYNVFYVAGIAKGVALLYPKGLFCPKFRNI